MARPDDYQRSDPATTAIHRRDCRSPAVVPTVPGLVGTVRARVPGSHRLLKGRPSNKRHPSGFDLLPDDHV